MSTDDAQRSSALLASAFGAIVLAIVVFSVLGGFGFLAYRSLLNGAAVSSGVLGATNAEAALQGVFGTIQFAIAVLSGVIVVFAVIVSFVVGRSARQAQEASRKELKEVADLYRENLKTVSDSLVNSAKHSVDGYLNEPGVSELLERYRSFISEIKANYETILPIIDNYNQFQKASEALEEDFAGPFLEIRGRVTDDRVDTRENRTLIQQALLGLQEGALKRRVSSSTVFNGAQMAARYEFTEIAHSLAVIAAWLNDTAIHRLRVRRAEYERGESLRVEKNSAGDFYLKSANPNNDPVEASRIRSQAYNQVFEALENVPLFNCHMLYSEVWNICVEAETFVELIEKLLMSIKHSSDKGVYIPSYCHYILALAYSSYGGVDWQTKTSEEIDTALEKFSLESPTSSWYLSTYQDTMRLASRLRFDIDRFVAKGWIPAPGALH